MAMLWPWIGFHLFVLTMLAVDLGVFHRQAHEVRFKEALAWSGVWIALALVFCGGVYYFRGAQPALEFLTGYVIEKSLSVDNIFVFMLIFGYFRVPARFQHGVLFWGIIGALVMRAIFIAAGVALLHHFHWIIYLFGVFLVITGIKLALEKEKEIHPERNLVLRLFRRTVPMTETYDEMGKFFVLRAGRWLATPLLAVLLVVEVTDVVFAIDSIPAVLAISHDPFIVYTSNVFAILGLRALYFALAGVMLLCHHLHYGLAFILSFVGIKMLLTDICHIPIAASLGVIALALALSIVASLIWPQRPIMPRHENPAGV